MSKKSINWNNAITVVSVAILVGTELVGLSWAAGWALGGLLGLLLVYYFVRAALKVEPIRG